MPLHHYANESGKRNKTSLPFNVSFHLRYTFPRRVTFPYEGSGVLQKSEIRKNLAGGSPQKNIYFIYIYSSRRQGAALRVFAVQLPYMEVRYFASVYRGRVTAPRSVLQVLIIIEMRSFGK